jgi:hypothetical protein
VNLLISEANVKISGPKSLVNPKASNPRRTTGKYAIYFFPTTAGM